MIFYGQLCVFVFLSAGVYLLYRQWVRAAPSLTAKQLKTALVNRKGAFEQFYDLLIHPFIVPVSHFIRIETQKRLQLQAQLLRVGWDMSPEEFEARALISAGWSTLMPVAMLGLGMGYVAMVGVALVAVIYLHFKTAIKDELKILQEAIEYGLPNFIRSILYKVGKPEKGVQADLISIFEQYYEVIEATGENAYFAFDIAQLVMEMKAMDVETALRRFDGRLRLPTITFLVQALIGIHRGEDQTVRLQALADDMNKLAAETLKRELAKRPGRAKWAIAPLVACAAISLLYTLVTDLLVKMGVLF